MSIALQPTALRKTSDGLEITWNTSETTSVTWMKLRLECPCAACKEEKTQPADPFRVLKPHEIPQGPLAPTAFTPVGNYAYKITWNDGHSTGIYPFEFLFTLSKGP